MTDARAPLINLALDGFGADADPAFVGALSFMIEQQGLLQTLLTGVVELVPDITRWRLTLTDDIISTVNSVSGRADDDPYTTDRGAGHAGAITLPRDDGTFDIVVSADVLFATREELATVDDLAAHVSAAAAHISRHEAGHAALRLRGEDADSYQDVQGLSNSDAACRKPLAAHVDDNRIEQYTALHAPSPLHHVDHLTDAIAHLRAELNEAKRTWRADIGAAAYRTLTAANGLVRVFAYLSPELGLDENGTPRRPDPLPDGWEEYIEHSWDDWSLTFHRLRPVDERMTTDEIGTVLADLCRLMNSWMSSIGVDWGLTEDDREYIFWRKNRY
ncbi:hypothetical protein GCM10010910_04090 [Microbacterium nanhaiense]|uniref:Uncharacterized protein n=1 Tax=Microbacterium nanhaiense TaxID=1301026 RepID=A0ABQ2MY19_9MICO|nr:hypothetical protein [Microbacterium nanhaiense]GGO59933.1 hypothetical protein GCM10010910_04090 [Microbacterium nanhaiense]